MLIPFGVFSAAGAGGGAAAGAYEVIETQILSSTAASVTFSSIPQTYKHLQLRAVASTPSWPGMTLTVNGDTSASYAGHELYGNGSSVSSGVIGTSANNLTGFLRWDTQTGAFGAGVIDFLDYSSTSKNKTFRALSGGVGTGGNSRIEFSSGLLFKTTAISSVTLATVAGTAAIGSRFSLYGIKG